MFHKNNTNHKVSPIESSKQKNELNNLIKSIKQSIDYYWAIKVIDSIPRHLPSNDVTNPERIRADTANSERICAELIKDIIRSLDLFIRDQFILADFKTHFDYIKKQKPSFCDYRNSIFDSTHKLLWTMCKIYYPSYRQFVDLFDTLNKLNSDQTLSRKNALRGMLANISDKINSSNGYGYEEYGYDQRIYDKWIVRWNVFLNKITIIIKEKQNQYSQKKVNSRLFSSTPQRSPNTSSITGSQTRLPVFEVFSASTRIPVNLFKKI